MCCQKPSSACGTSTSEVYGTAKYVPIDEKHPMTPQSPYSATKIEEETPRIVAEETAALRVPNIGMHFKKRGREDL